MSKELIKIVGNYIQGGIPEEYKLIHEKQVDYDNEAFFEVYTYEVVIQRISDQKFFMSFYKKYEKDPDIQWFEELWFEVFPKQITVYVSDTSEDF